jgi:hypothetical protein
MGKGALAPCPPRVDNMVLNGWARLRFAHACDSDSSSNSRHCDERPHSRGMKYPHRSSGEPTRPSHPAPRFVTIAIRPLHQARNGATIRLICSSEKAKYFSREDLT